MLAKGRAMGKKRFLSALQPKAAEAIELKA